MKRAAFFMGALMLPTVAIAPAPCDQKTYDQIYYALVLDLIAEPNLGAYEIRKKNDGIDWLRKLCRGQKSTYEMGTK